MFGIIMPVVTVARSVAIAVAPYAMTWASTAVRVAPIVAGVNVGLRVASRGGYNYMKRTRTEWQLDELRYRVENAHGTMPKEQITELAEEVPSVRPTTFGQKVSWAWNAVWTSGLATVGATWAVITWPVYATAWILGNLTYALSSVVISAASGLGVSRVRTTNGRERMYRGTRSFIGFFKLLSMTAGGVLVSPFTTGILKDLGIETVEVEVEPPLATVTPMQPYVQPFIVYPQTTVPDDKVVPNDTVKGETVKTETTTTATPPMPEADILGNGPGLKSLKNSYQRMVTEFAWDDEYIARNPEQAALAMLADIKEKKRGTLVAAKASLLAFAFEMNLDEDTRNRFVATFVDPDSALVSASASTQPVIP